MTAITITRGTGVAVGVTGDAGDSLVPTGQRERRRMVEVGVTPAPESCLVAGLAIERESGRSMVGFFGRSVVGRVAVITFHRGAGVFLLGMPAVAGFAVRHGMGAGQSKAIGCVQLKGILAVLPVSRGVTALAFGTELAVVLIGMAVDTGRTDMAEDGIFVTADTLCGRMSTHQRKSGRGMIKPE